MNMSPLRVKGSTMALPSVASRLSGRRCSHHGAVRVYEGNGSVVVNASPDAMESRGGSAALLGVNTETRATVGPRFVTRNVSVAVSPSATSSRFTVASSSNPLEAAPSCCSCVKVRTALITRSAAAGAREVGIGSSPRHIPVRVAMPAVHQRSSNRCATSMRGNAFHGVCTSTDVRSMVSTRVRLSNTGFCAAGVVDANRFSDGSMPSKIETSFSAGVATFTRVASRRT